MDFIPFIVPKVWIGYKENFTNDYDYRSMSFISSALWFRDPPKVVFREKIVFSLLAEH